MKPTKQFKMVKPTKYMMATLDKQEKSDYKSLMIQAQLHEEEGRKEKYSEDIFFGRGSKKDNKPTKTKGEQ